MPPVCMARHAMATRFELVLHGENPVSLRAAGEEALREIDRIEAQLSLFQPTSEIAHVNARAASEPVRVTPTLFALLEQAQRLSRETGGAFDITIAPLVRCWGFMGGSGCVPDPEALAEARANVGMHLVHLSPPDLTVQFAKPGVMLDLGAIGKGYAIERATEVLRDAGVENALLHGGTSTVYGLGRPPETESWQVAIQKPAAMEDGRIPGPGTATVPKTGSVQAPDLQGATKPLSVVGLRDEAMSVSAVWGKSFDLEGKTYGHIIDPITGEPARRAILSAVVLPSATETDALSTALLTLGLEGHDGIANLRPGIRTLVVAEASGKFMLQTSGITVACE